MATYYYIGKNGSEVHVGKMVLCDNPKVYFMHANCSWHRCYDRPTQRPKTIREAIGKLKKICKIKSIPSNKLLPKLPGFVYGNRNESNFLYCYREIEGA